VSSGFSSPRGSLQSSARCTTASNPVRSSTVTRRVSWWIAVGRAWERSYKAPVAPEAGIESHHLVPAVSHVRRQQHADVPVGARHQDLHAAGTWEGGARLALVRDGLCKRERRGRGGNGAFRTYSDRRPRTRRKSSSRVPSARTAWGPHARSRGQEVVRPHLGDHPGEAPGEGPLRQGAMELARHRSRSR
jgi:hypothetical protein